VKNNGGLHGGKRRILLLEERGVFADNVMECLNNYDFECVYLDQRERELCEDDFRDVDAVVLGVDGGGVTSMSILRQVQRLSGGKPIIVLSSIGRSPTRQEMQSAGDIRVVNKPFKAQELMDVLAGSIVG